MSSPCDICLEKDCKNPGHCDCSKCSKRVECPRRLRATIRITTKCTQSCSHCCFACSPKSTDIMTIEMAKQVAKFLESNGVRSVNLMGGEFFMNTQWYSITKEFLSVVNSLRLVTNGDWAHNQNVKEKLLKLSSNYRDKIHLSVSYDKWHNNKNVQDAVDFLDTNKIRYNVAGEGELKDDSIVSVGRAQSEYGFYSTFGCYCNNPQYQYSFLINETGEIFKCSFGVFDYANVKEYLDGGFRVRFKEFNKKFYDIFIPSCASCIRHAQQHDRIDANTRKLR